MKNAYRALGLALGLMLFMQGNVASAEIYDLRPPTLAIVTPVAGVVAEGVLTVTGTANDRHGVKKVQVKVVGSRYRRAIGTQAWAADIDTTRYSPGPHKLKVRAFDRFGNKRVRATWVNFADQGQGYGSQSSITTPEGARIEINSKGPWTADRIYQMLVENGLNDAIGPSLTVKVQDQYASQSSASVTGVPGNYRSISATIYLKGVNSSFASSPDAILAHEFGHVWAYYHLYLTKQGDWSSYLDARGLTDHPKLDSSYAWDRDEIIAEDYRLLFGSAKTLSQWPSHMNGELPHPRDVAGLREFMANSWTAAS